MMQRRAFAAGMAALVGAPRRAQAQQAGKIYRIGTLHTATPHDASERVKAFERRLAELGYVDGRNLILVHRYSGADLRRVGDLASEARPGRRRHNRHFDES